MFIKIILKPSLFWWAKKYKAGDNDQGQSQASCTGLELSTLKHLENYTFSLYWLMDMFDVVLTFIGKD